MSSGYGFKTPSTAATLITLGIVFCLIAAMNFFFGTWVKESMIISNCVKASGATQAECIRKLNELQGKK